MKALIAVLALSLTLLGCGVLPGTTAGSSSVVLPSIINVVSQATDTTIEVKFSTSTAATPSLACGLTPGSYTLVAKDNGVDADSTLNHVQIVAGNLAPSTMYYCQIGASTTAGSVQTSFSIATTATPATTPITGAVLGATTLYNSINPNNQGTGDTFYNCKSDDGNTYMVSNDNSGFFINGQPTAMFAEMSLTRVTSESPMVVQTIQRFLGYESPTQGFLQDGFGSKGFGLFCLDHKLFLSYGRQNQDHTQPAHSNGAGNVLMSEDHGVSWDNPQDPSVFSPNGTPPNPLSSSMWPGSPATMGSMAFVKYGADDGTLGYFDPANQHDNGNAFVYTVFNEGVWNGGGVLGGGNVLYIARVPRAMMQNLNGSDWQWFTGGDGNLDANWSSSESAAKPMLSAYGLLGTPDVVYIAALNRYVLLTFDYPLGAGTNGNILDCVWHMYESPHPWGPWTLAYRQEFVGPHGGAYNPIILSDTAFTGTAPTVMWTGNYTGAADYVLEFSTLTLTH